MRTVIKPVYYCDACGKHALTKSIERHERSCTLNQNRECNMCDQPSGYLLPLLDDYASRFILFQYRRADLTGQPIHVNAWDFDETIIPIFNKPLSVGIINGDVDNCPICTLAIIRILGLSFYYFRGKFGKRTFDYQEAKNAWWYAKNIEDQRAEMYG